MQIVAAPHIVRAFADALARPHPGEPEPAAAEITAKAVASGWLGTVEIESLFLVTDPRLYQITTRELLAAFEIPLQTVFERPPRKVFEAEGIDRVSVAELARLLILMERCGFAIDPRPLCSAMMLDLSSKRLLTGPELQAYWRAQGRIAREPVTILAGPEGDSAAVMRRRPPDTAITASGHVVEAWRPDAPVVALRITPPTPAARSPLRIV